LAVLSNIESFNSILIKQGVDKKGRFEILQSTARDQLKALNNLDFLKSLKHTSNDVYVEALQEKKNEPTLDQTLKGLLSVPPPKRNETK
jgi:hypothetical protein